MGVEIERKFLVREDFHPDTAGTPIAQGYLSRDPARTVRVRIAGERAYLTIKGKNGGAARAEFEYEIPAADARELLALCDAPLVEKTRCRIPHAGHLWEVDIFHGANAGLCVAEVELGDEQEKIDLPQWITREVTGEKRYYNSSLIAHPYILWTAEERGVHPLRSVDK